MCTVTVWCGVLVCARTCVNRGRDRDALLTVTVLRSSSEATTNNVSPGGDCYNIIATR